MEELLQGQGGIIAGAILALWILRELAKLRKPTGTGQQDLKDIKKVCYEIKKKVDDLHEWHSKEDDEGRLLFLGHKTRALIVKIWKKLGGGEPTKM